jgi:mRNA degradation ribonuclease J1/J2
MMKRTIWKRTQKPLSLASPGNLRLFFVGVGSAFSRKHNQTNLLVLKGKDHLLIDCGTKCPQALDALGLPVSAVQHLLITHSHADHIGGLEEFALVGRYFAKKRPTMIITEEYKNILWEMSLKGGIAFGELVSGRPLEFEDVFEPMTPVPHPALGREAWRASAGSIELTLFRTKHMPDSAASWRDSFFSLGVVIDGRVLFTSDTRYDPEVVLECDARFSPEAIFHDCQFFTGGVHASLEELKQLPAAIKKKTYLTHYGDDWSRFRDKVREYGFAGLARQDAFYDFPSRR